MRIEINIESREADKGGLFFRAEIEHRSGGSRTPRFLQTRDFETEHGAHLWILDEVDTLLFEGAYREPVKTHCRCCNTDLKGSDHCPSCGCEEFEETCCTCGTGSCRMHWTSGTINSLCSGCEAAERAGRKTDCQGRC